MTAQRTPPAEAIQSIDVIEVRAEPKICVAKVPRKHPETGRLWLTDGSCIHLSPARAKHGWACDVVEGKKDQQTARWTVFPTNMHDRRKFRMLCIVDEFTREALNGMARTGPSANTHLGSAIGCRPHALSIALKRTRSNLQLPLIEAHSEPVGLYRG